MNEKKGKQSIKFGNPPYILGAAAVAGPKEIDGPMARYFDRVSEDATFGKDSWEEGESEMVRQAVTLAIQKAGIVKQDIRYIFAGDLLGQLIASTFGIKDMEIPVFGLYGACSTCGEALSLASMTVAAGYADNVIAEASSHYGSAEKQFRFPLEYGNQRPLSATWTVTGSGAFVVSDRESDVCIQGVTTGQIVDYGVKDSLNMGACMAPAAGNVIIRNLIDNGRKPEWYDKIITGDLGLVGKDILLDIMRSKGYDIADRYMDCGIEIYSREQNIQAGGSGCGCSATMLAGYILKMLESGKWHRVLFVPTGALLSPVSFNEGDSVPGIAHAVVLECGETEV